MEDRKYYTAKEAEDALGITYSALRHQVKIGNIRSVIPPGKRQAVYVKEDIDQLTHAGDKKYYTAKEAEEILGMTYSALRNQVDAGNIRSIIVPGRQQAVYTKTDVDQLAKDLQVFFAIRDSTRTSFRKATKSDIPKCIEIGMASHPNAQQQGLTTLETRLSWLEKNPDLYYVIEQDGEIVGYTSIIPLEPEKIKEILDSRELTMDITPDEIEEFKPGKPLHIFIATMRTKPNISKVQKRIYGVRLIGGLISTIIGMLENEVKIQAFYGNSDTVDGIRIMRHMGFTEIPSVTDSKNYILEMDKEGRTTLEKYKRFFKEK